MRQIFNDFFYRIADFEPYDWILVCVGFLLYYLVPPVLINFFYWIMKNIFRLEKRKYIKGWKRIEKKRSIFFKK